MNHIFGGLEVAHEAPDHDLVTLPGYMPLIEKVAGLLNPFS